MGQLLLDDLNKLKLGIENAHYWLLDILDYDRLARYFNPNAKMVGRAILTEYLNGRNAAAKSLYEYFIHNQEADPRFSTSLLSLPKGAAFFARVLRLNQVGDLTPFALTGLCAIASFQRRTRGIADDALSYEDATLRKAYEQILHHVAYRIKSLSMQQIGDVFMDLAQLPEAAWIDLIAAQDTRATITALVERGIALGLHRFEESAVVAALGIDQTSESSIAKTCWGQCIAIIVGLFTSIFMQHLQRLAPEEFGDQPLDEAEQQQTEVEPLPAETLDLLGLLLKTEVPEFQKEYLSQVVSPLIRCGGFELKSEEEKAKAERAILGKIQGVEEQAFGGDEFPTLGSAYQGMLPQELDSMFPNFQ